MKLSHLTLMAAALMLAACSSSHRPVYSGHQESTEGVPGFVNGKKVSPHVKLGQSYTVDGETFVPRHQPDYVEEGMASWYGPGFHGGKTANGEEFDSSELTAAHRTLPLPSIVRVTMISTGKQVYVRINDRGPFAHSRIIDLSRGAAEKIGLLRAGVAKVRVEYMAAESERFAELLAQGRDPKSIDVASEVLNHSYAESSPAPQHYAQNESVKPSAAAKKTPSRNPSFWDSVIPNAEAAEPTAGQPLNETSNAAPIGDVQVEDANDSNNGGESPFDVAEQADALPPREEPEPLQATNLPSPSPMPPPPPSTQLSGAYVQLGAFQNQGNAERLKQQFPGATITRKSSSSGQMLFHVRMGPYSSPAESTAAMNRAKSAGIDAKIVRD